MNQRDMDYVIQAGRDLATARADLTRAGQQITDQLVEIERLKGVIARKDEDHRNLLLRITSGMPECWPDTDEAIADFVDSLINGATDQPGHADDCTCFTG